MPLFKDKAENVIDDISALPKYIDLVYMCSVGDIINNANYTYSMFRELAKQVKVDLVIKE